MFGIGETYSAASAVRLLARRSRVGPVCPDACRKNWAMRRDSASGIRATSAVAAHSVSCTGTPYTTAFSAATRSYWL